MTAKKAHTSTCSSSSSSHSQARVGGAHFHTHSAFQKPVRIPGGGLGTLGPSEPETTQQRMNGFDCFCQRFICINSIKMQPRPGQKTRAEETRKSGVEVGSVGLTPELEDVVSYFKFCSSLHAENRTRPTLFCRAGGAVNEPLR